MAIVLSRTVTDGLVFYYDMYNTKKSFVGKPVTNQFLIPTPASNGDVTFAINGTGTFKRITSGVYGGYAIQPDDVVYRYDLGAHGCHYHGNGATLTSGQYATFTFDYYVSQDAQNYPSVNYLANMETAGSGAGGSTGVPNNLKGVWQTVTFTSNAATATGGINMYLYPGACNNSNSYLATSGYILYKNPQVIFSSTVPDTAPYVAGTRSTSQAVLDLKKNNQLTISSLTYNSSGNFTFNGTSDYIYTSSPVKLPTGSQNGTVIVWCKPDSTGPSNQYTGLVSYGSRTSVNPSSSRVLSLYTSGTTMYVSSAFWGNDYTPNTLAVNANQWNMVGMISRGPGTTNNVTLICGNSNGLTLQTGSSNNYTYGLNTSNTNLAIGCTDYPGRYFKGEIAIVQIYDRELSPNEITKNYNGFRGRFGL